MTPWINIWAKFVVVLFSRVGYSHENYMNSHSYRHMFFLLLGCWQAVLKVFWFSSGDVVVHSTCVKRKVQVLSVQFTFLLCLMCWEVCSSVEANISTNAFSKIGRFYWSNHKMQVWVGDVFASLLNKCGLTITWAFCFLYEKAETFDKNCQRQHAFYCTWWNSLPTHVYSNAVTSRQSLRSAFWNHKRTHCLGKLLPKLLWVKCCLGPHPQRGESSARVARTQILVYIIYIYICIYNLGHY